MAGFTPLSSRSTLPPTDMADLVREGHGDVPYTAIPTPTPESSEVLNYASVIAGVVTWIIIIGAMLIILRKLFLCVVKTTLDNCTCGRSCLRHPCTAAFCSHFCCIDLSEIDSESSVATSTNSEDPPFFVSMPPSYDVALTMPKPDKPTVSIISSDLHYKIDSGVDNEAFDDSGDRMPDPDLPTYNDALQMQQNIIHSVNCQLGEGSSASSHRIHVVSFENARNIRRGSSVIELNPTELQRQQNSLPPIYESDNEVISLSL